MFIIHDFCVAKFIDGRHYDDLTKLEPRLIPNFDEVKFPFILLIGHKCASIVNVRDGFHQPIIEQFIVSTNGP